MFFANRNTQKNMQLLDKIHTVFTAALLLLLLFLTFSALVANPKKTTVLYTVANPARGLLNREKKKKKKSGIFELFRILRQTFVL